MRNATIERKTKETQIALSLALDGSGEGTVETGIGFFDHMLELLKKHALIDLTVKATGDLRVDYHHTVEDVGLVFGKALNEALGDRKGLTRCFVVSCSCFSFHVLRDQMTPFELGTPFSKGSTAFA